MQGCLQAPGASATPTYLPALLPACPLALPLPPAGQRRLRGDRAQPARVPCCAPCLTRPLPCRRRRRSLPQASGNYAVIAPNMGKQIVAFQVGAPRRGCCG